MRNRICKLVSALRLWTTILAFLVAGIGLAPHVLLANAPPNNPRIVNGVFTSDFPSTGALLRNGGAPATSLNASAWCSGILIGCETFLTAAHCVFDDPSPADYLVFLQHAGFFSVTSIAIHPSHPQNDATGDIAVLKLGAPVTGIAPSPLDTSAQVAFGTTATIVGFGRSGGGSSNADYGLKRVGDVTTASCGNLSNDTTSLCWNFTSPVGPPGSDANTCNGDSGGPLFVQSDCGFPVVGVTSIGLNGTCLTPDLSADASVLSHATFITAQGGSDLTNQTCGSLSHVGDTNTTANAFTGEVTSGSPQATHSFVVPNGTAELRVAFNAVDDGPSNFDVYIRRGSAPTTAVFDCAHTGSNQFGYCEFGNPTADTWFVLVNRVSGSGTYQVTATTFGTTLGAFPQDGVSCSNGVPCLAGATCNIQQCSGGIAAVDGTTCDDGSSCTQVDECQSGICRGDATPRMTCKAPPQRANLLITDRTKDAQDRITLNMVRGPATTAAEYEDPTTGSPDYHLCVYDSDSGQSLLKIDTIAPGGGTCKSGKPCWKRMGSASNPRGYNYADADLTPDGLLRMKLTAGTAGRSHIKAAGKGENLILPGPITGNNYFVHDPSVTVQVVQDDGDCWSVSFNEAQRNTSSVFSARCGTGGVPCN